MRHSSRASDRQRPPRSELITAMQQAAIPFGRWAGLTDAELYRLARANGHFLPRPTPAGFSGGQPQPG